MGRLQPQQEAPAESAPTPRPRFPSPKHAGASGRGVSPRRRGRSPEEHARAEVGALQRVGLHLRVHRQHPARRAAESRGGAARMLVSFPPLVGTRARMLGFWPPRGSARLELQDHPLPGARRRRPASSPPPPRAAPPRRRRCSAPAWSRSRSRSREQTGPREECEAGLTPPRAAHRGGAGRPRCWLEAGRLTAGTRVRRQGTHVLTPGRKLYWSSCSSPDTGPRRRGEARALPVPAAH